MFTWLFGFSYWTVAADVAAVTAILIFLSSFVSIREDQVGVVVKRFSPGKAMPEGRVVALNGEAGYQARPLGPGIHFGYWPWQYKIDKYPFTRD